MPCRSDRRAVVPRYAQPWFRARLRILRECHYGYARMPAHVRERPRARPERQPWFIRRGCAQAEQQPWLAVEAMSMPGTRLWFRGDAYAARGNRNHNSAHTPCATMHSKCGSRARLRTSLTRLAHLGEQQPWFRGRACARAEQQPWFVAAAVRAREREPWFGEHACARAGIATMVLCACLRALLHSKCGLVYTRVHTLSSHHGSATRQPWFRGTCVSRAGSRTMVLRTRCTRAGQQSMFCRRRFPLCGTATMVLRQACAPVGAGTMVRGKACAPSRHRTMVRAQPQTPSRQTLRITPRAYRRSPARRGARARAVLSSARRV